MASARRWSRCFFRGSAISLVCPLALIVWVAKRNDTQLRSRSTAFCFK